MKPTTLVTERLILRRAIDADINALFHNYSSDPHSSRFLTRQPHSNTNQTAQFLNDWCDKPWEQEFTKFAWVVSLKKNNEAIGVFLVSEDGQHKAEIHYGIGRLFCQQGFATEVCQVAVQWLMTQPKLQRIWAVCDLLNYGSIKVLENNGFQREGILRNWLQLPAFGNTARDCYIYAQTWNV